MAAGDAAELVDDDPFRVDPAFLVAADFGDQFGPVAVGAVEVGGADTDQQLPGLLLSAGIMAARLRGPFLGPTGYVRSCVTGQVAWPAGFFGIFGIFVALVYVMR